MTIPRLNIRAWMVYFGTILLSSFFHELGHSIVAWVHGYGAIPTLAKEYPLQSLAPSLNQVVSAGGIFFSVLFAIAGILFYLKSNWSYRAGILAGTLAMPAIYTLRFVLMGRGHDGTEFQEAQAACRLQYAGHATDWLFAVLVFAGMMIWLIQSKPGKRTWISLLSGAILTVVFIVLLQTLNNRLFDPLFSK